MNPHNPDNLTPEQVGVADGWRLLDEDEYVLDGPTLLEIEGWNGAKWVSGMGGREKECSYRTRLSRAALRKARGLEGETPSVESATEKLEAAEFAIDRVQGEKPQPVKTLADEIAIAAMQGIVATDSRQDQYSTDHIATWAYQIADAMLAEKARREGK